MGFPLQAPLGGKQQLPGQRQFGGGRGDATALPHHHPVYPRDSRVQWAQRGCEASGFQAVGAGPQEVPLHLRLPAACVQQGHRQSAGECPAPAPPNGRGGGLTW